MFKFILSLLTVLVSTSAFATSLHPCTPTIEASPSQMSCYTAQLDYSINIITFMSDPVSCPKHEDRVEYHTAVVTISNRSGAELRTLTIQNDDFTYSLGGGGSDGYFKSPKHRLNLKKCVSPLDGGVSFGN